MASCPLPLALLAPPAIEMLCVMEHLKSILRLDFQEALRPWLEFRDVVRIAGGDEKAEVQVGPVVIDRPSERTRVVVQVRGVILEQEAPPSIEGGVRDAIEFMIALNGASEFPKIGLMHHNTIFIEPYELPFHELVALLKAQCLRGTIADDATDISLLLDQHEDGRKTHVQFGPMDAEQIKKEYLRWPPDDVPDTFVFLAVSYEATQEGSEFSSGLLETFLEDAVRAEAAQADAIFGSLKENGG